MERIRHIPWEAERVHEAAYRAMEDAAIELRRAIGLAQMVCLRKPFPQSIAIMLSDLGRDRVCQYIERLLGENV